jgi:hypothetical protein
MAGPEALGAKAVPVRLNQASAATSNTSNSMPSCLCHPEPGANRQIRRLVLYVHAVRPRVVGAAQVRGRISWAARVLSRFLAGGLPPGSPTFPKDPRPLSGAPTTGQQGRPTP